MYKVGEPDGIFQYFYNAERTLEIANTNQTIPDNPFIISAVKVDAPRVVLKTSQKPEHRVFPANDALIIEFLKELKKKKIAHSKKAAIVRRHPDFKVKQATIS